MMTLTGQDKELIKAWVREGAFEAFAEAVETHVDGCPHGKKIGNFKAWIVGVGVGFSLAGGVAGFVLAIVIG